MKINKKSLILILIMIIIISIIVVIINKNNKTKITTQVHTQRSDAEPQISIMGIDTEMKSKIKDIDEFLLKLKEYLYSQGIFSGDTLKLIQKKEEDNEIHLKFEFDDVEKTKIIVDINLNDNTYKFYNYRR